MFDSKTTGITYDKCLYCGNYHSYGPDMCRELHERQDNTTPIVGTIPEIVFLTQDQLSKIIHLLEDIKYNTDRLRVK